MRRGLLLALISLSTGAAWAQTALSARAGLIHYVQGKVLVEGERVEPSTTEFIHLNQDELLTTQLGRAEILLNPGTFLRVGEDSSVRLLSTDLTDTRLELVSGQALIEVEDLRKDNAITVDFMGSQIGIVKRGLYQLDAETGVLRVYDGEAQVGDGAIPLKVKKGKAADFGGAEVTTAKFDREDADGLYRWSARRARYVARANASAAQAAGRGRVSGWSFNPVYGMYSYLPNSGYAYSPFGIGIYAPVIVMRPSFGSGMSSGSIGGGSMGGGGAVVRSAPAAAPVSTGGGRRR